MKLYMFRTVPLSIIRSFSLYTQQWYTSYRFADSFWAGPACSKAVCKPVHLVGFIIRIRNNAQSREHKSHNCCLVCERYMIHIKTLYQKIHCPNGQACGTQPTVHTMLQVWLVNTVSWHLHLFCNDLVLSQPPSDLAARQLQPTT
jgi:hypothetical protein